MIRGTTTIARQALWAAVFVILWGNMNVFAHHYAVHHGAQAVGIALISVSAAALVMLAYGGWQLATARQTLRYPLTWLYAVCRVGAVICLTLGLTSLTPGTAMFLSITDILFTLPLVWAVLGRRSPTFDVVCALGLLLGLIGMVQHIENRWLNMGMWWLFGEGVLNAIMAVTMEKHPTWPHGLSWKARSAFTGAVLLATCIALYAVFVLLALLGLVLPLPEGLLAWADPVALWTGLFSGATWVFGVLLGMMFRAPMMLMSFVALRGLKSELYTAMWAVFPLLTWGTEWALYRLGYWAQPPIVGEGLGWGLLMVFSLMVMALAQLRRMLTPKDAKKTA